MADMSEQSGLSASAAAVADTEAGCHEELATIARGAGTTFFGKMIGGAIQYLYLVVLARSIGVAALGVLTIGMVIVEFLGILTRCGMEGGASKYVALYNGAHDPGRVKGTIVQSLALTLALSLATACVLLAVSIGSSFDEWHGLGAVLGILALSLPFVSLTIIIYYSMQGFKNMLYTVYCQNVLMPLLCIGVFLCLYLFDFGVEAAAWAYVVAAVCVLACSLVFLKKLFPEFSAVAPVYEFKKLASFSLPMLTTNVAVAFILMADVMFLGYFMADADVGAYNAAMKTVVLMKMVITSFVPIFSPIVADIYNKGEMKKLELLYKAANRWTFTFSLPIFLLFFLLSREIMLIFGGDFTVASMSLVILALAQLVDASTGLALIVLMMSGKEQMLMFNCVATALFAVLANWVLIPVYGLTGAALANLATFVLLDLLLLAQTYYLYKIHPFGTKMLKPCACGAVAMGCVMLADLLLPALSLYGRTIAVIVVFTASFLGMLKLVQSDDDFGFIVDIMKQKLGMVG